MKLSKAILLGIICGLLFYATFAPYAYFERGGRFDLGGEFVSAIIIAIFVPAFIKDAECKKKRKIRIARERAERSYKCKENIF